MFVFFMDARKNQHTPADSPAPRNDGHGSDSNKATPLPPLPSSSSNLSSPSLTSPLASQLSLPSSPKSLSSPVGPKTGQQSSLSLFTSSPGRGERPNKTSSSNASAKNTF